MKYLTGILLILICTQPCLWARDFFFLATEDHHFENPANWYPAYPGTKITPEDKITVMADVNFSGYNLHVAGIMEIMLNATVHSPDGSIIIRKHGLLDNNGKLLVDRVSNYGKLYNRLAAVVHIYTYEAFSGAHTYNGYSATFRTISHLVNQGRFDNYSDCISGSDLKNTSIFNQIRHSQLQVTGELVLAPGSTFQKSQESTVFLRSGEFIPTQRKHHGIFR